MNKEYLKENNLYEAHKQFMRLCEWSFVSRNVMEDDDEEQNANMGGDMNQQDPMQGGDMPMGDDPMMGGEQDTMQGGEGEQNPEMGDDMNQQDPMQGGDMPMGDDPMMGGEGMGDMPPMDDPMMGGEDMGEDEEVIDVDDLTDAQEKTYDKMGDLSKKFDKLLNVIDKFEEVIAMNDEKIDSLEANIKAELEKRNPTAIEKLNLRSQNDSQPFNVSPTDFWKEKEATSNYRIGDDMEDDAPQYKIMQGDIDEVGDWRSISQSLDTGDFKQTLNQILNF